MTNTDHWIAEVGVDEFEERVITASHTCPILVDLWAEWCSPCLVVAPVLEQLIAEYEGEVQLAKVEVDVGDNMKLAGRYAVKGFPTIILFINGEERDRFSGARPLSFIRQFVDEHLSVT